MSNLPANATSDGVQRTEELRCIGNEAFSKGKYCEAEQHYSDAIAISQTSAKFFHNRALTTLKLNKLEDALEDATRAIELDNTYLKCLYLKSRILKQLNRIQDAQNIIFQIFEMDENFADEQNLLVEICESEFMRNLYSNRAVIRYNLEELKVLDESLSDENWLTGSKEVFRNKLIEACKLWFILKRYLEKGDKIENEYCEVDLAERIGVIYNKLEENRMALLSYFICLIKIQNLTKDQFEKIKKGSLYKQIGQTYFIFVT